MKTQYKKLAKFLLRYFRLDLQLHFLWSFFLPLVWLGLIATITKEALDLWSKGHWSWDDFIVGTIGWIFGIIFLYNQIWF